MRDKQAGKIPFCVWLENSEEEVGEEESCKTDIKFTFSIYFWDTGNHQKVFIMEGHD